MLTCGILVFAGLLAGVVIAIKTGEKPGTGPSANAAAADRTEAGARQTAQAELDAYAAGDWQGAWDLWTKAGKAAISRNDYQRLHTECETVTGIPFEVKTVRLEGPDRAVFTGERASFQFTYELHFEDGHWRYQPEAKSLADYAKGVDALIAACKK